MQLENNLFGESIDYTQPYLTELSEDEEKACESALQDVEDAIARITKLQSRRKGRNGTIETPLRLDEIQKIDLALEELDENLAILKLSVKLSFER